ncbi:hypothetical protein OHA18_25480 [Kribbella sp. NBC_00709]|uniref:hypothetical protein n=1 Tax=Kribbella sp. NBC_00709 TaxID=2975972 RepID=UPI002E29AD34|nr:hypothetical protein [Kribbella sp. NBC_00709]
MGSSTFETPVFKLVFLTVLGLTVAALILNVVLVMAIDQPNDQAKSLIETCSTIVKAGFGAIVGLIGGKSV